MNKEENPKYKLYILGAGGLAAEVFFWLSSSPIWMKQYVFCGFVDKYVKETKILERVGYPQNKEWEHSLDNFCLDKESRFIYAIGEPKSKKTHIQESQILEEQFVSFIHDSSLVSKNTIFKGPTLIGPFCSIEPNVTLGKFTTINSYAFIGHDCSLGDYSTLSPRSTMLGASWVGERCFLGANCTINIKRKVADGSFIGMDTSVIKNTEKDSKIYGVPGVIYDRK